MSDEVIAFLRAKGQALIDLGPELQKQGADATSVVNIGLELANRAMEMEHPGLIRALGGTTPTKPN